MRSILLAGAVLFAAMMVSRAAENPSIALRPIIDCAGNPGAEHLAIYAPEGWHCLAPPLITERDFTRLERRRDTPSPVLNARLTEEARMRLYRFSMAHLGSHVAIMIQGRPTRVERIGGPWQSGWMTVSGGYMTNTELNQVADKFYADGGRD